MSKNRFSITAILLTLCLVLGQLIPITASATTNDPTISISNTQGYAGETVDVTVIMENNPGLVAAVLTVEYDSKVMTLTGVTDGGILGAQVHSDVYESPYSLSWMNFTATSDYTNSGVIATLTFKLSEDVETEQVCDVKISYSKENDDILNCDGEVVDFATVDGSVTIKVPEKPVESVSLEKTSLDITAGDTVTLTPSFTPANATNKNVKWESNNEAVATVKNGLVTAVAKGKATITVITEDGAKTATCIVNVACAHKDFTPYTKVEPTCTSKGHETYTFCNQCNTVIEGEDKEIAMLPHDYTHHDRVEATHTTAGNIEYWTCGECEQYFTDENGTVVGKENVIIPANSDAHDETGLWNYDSESHWKDCGCSIRVLEGAHEYDNACDTECNVCKYTRTIEHDWEKTYTYDADSHWIKCSVCGEKQSAPEQHKGGVATCQKAAECAVCKQTYGTTISHKYSGEIADKKYEKIAATCMAPAVYYKSCTMCGTSGKDTFVGTTLDVDNHTGNNHVEGAVEATCYQVGYSGDTYCECGVKVESGTEIIKTKHTPSSTYETDGTYHWKVCAVGECQELIDKRTHDYDNVCDTECNVCKYTRTVTHPFDTATWVTDGTNHWHKCATQGCKEVTGVGTHTGGTATCQKQAECEVCEKAYGTVIPHEYTAETINKKYEKTAATCKNFAVYYKSCTMCGAAGDDTFNGTELDADNHVDGTELQGIKSASCTEKGYTGDIHCKGCSVKLESGKDIDKLPHDVQTWEITKESSVDEEGEKIGTCTICSQSFTVKTAKLVAELKGDKVEGNLKAEVEAKDDATLPGESIFVADDVTSSIVVAEKNKVEDAIEKAVEKIEEVTEKHVIASILDLKIVLREFATNGDSIKEKEHEPQGNLTVTVEIPDKVLKLFDNIVLLHVKDDGSVEEIPFTYVGGNKAKFQTNGFSYYVFAGTEKVVDVPNHTPATPSSPQTGDYGYATTWGMLFIAVGVCIVTVFVKRKYMK